MKRFLFLVLGTVLLSSCKYFGIDAISGSTLVWQSGSNNFFNQEASTTLPGAKYITLTGEVEKDVTLKLSKMPLRSVTVRETRLTGNSFKGTVISQGAFTGSWCDSIGGYIPKTAPTKENPVQIAPDGAPSISKEGLDFFGTYRYDGYALCDILSALRVDKLSKEEFWPPVDLYIEVSNEAGDRAVFSWGELFYSADMYSIMIAKRVTRVHTGKTGELWALPSQMQLVVKSDLYCERNIPNPTKITVRSLKGTYIVNRDSTVFVGQPDRVEVSVTENGNTSLLGIITKTDPSIPIFSYPEIYYGHGMGYKGEKVFRGQMIRDILAPYFSRTDAQSLRSGIVSVAAIDGYRASFSLSELINRNDASEPLLMHSFGKGEESGRETFSLFATCDAFADRSIKGLTEIRLIK